MKGPDKKPQVVAVDKDLYEAMVAAFHRVKEERFRNKVFAEKLDRQLSSLGSDINSFAARISELTVNANNLNNSVQLITDYNLKTSLGGKTDALIYGVMEMGDKVAKISGRIQGLRDALRPYKEYVEGGGPVAQRQDRTR